MVRPQPLPRGAGPAVGPAELTLLTRPAARARDSDSGSESEQSVDFSFPMLT